MADDAKLVARKRRERKLRLWLTTLSWSTPVIAFTGFFTLWHGMSSVTAHTTQNTTQPTTQANQPAGAQTSGAGSAMFSIGSNNQDVVMIQEALAELGYFDQQPTGYYGDVTAAAVKSFQSDNGLPVTGSIDRTTLLAIQNALQQNQMGSVSGSGNSSSSGSSNGGSWNSGSSGGTWGNSGGNQGSVGFSQQPAPSGMTGAS